MKKRTINGVLSVIIVTTMGASLMAKHIVDTKLYKTPRQEKLLAEHITLLKVKLKNDHSPENVLWVANEAAKLHSAIKELDPVLAEAAGRVHEEAIMIYDGLRAKRRAIYGIGLETPRAPHEMRE